MANSFSSSRFPYLPIHIQIGISKINLDLEAMVDTGFGGGIAIPKNIVDLSYLPYMTTHWVLADGTEILAKAYLGYVRIGKFDPVGCTIALLGDEPLIGREVINHFKVTLNHGKKIMLEP